MVTPKKEQIIERAKELFFQHEWKNGNRTSITPSERELKESGWLSVAQSELMRNEDTEYRSYIEREATELGIVKGQVQYKSCLTANMGFPIDLEECRKSNILITGTNAQGKTLAAMQICDILINNNWQCLVFDSSGIWKSKSSIPDVCTVRKKKDKVRMYLDRSMIFDISLLLPRDQKKFLEQILSQIWVLRVLQRPQRWCLIVLEEAHLYMRNIRGLVSQNLMRICSVGRNWKIRTLAISPSLTGLDCEFVRLAQQRYHFRLGNEVNAKRRFRSYYGLDWCRECQNLDVGFALYVNKEKLEVWKIPEFQKRQLKVEA
jgi:hypothetical protein